jgi:hypothetical protein
MILDRLLMFTGTASGTLTAPAQGQLTDLAVAGPSANVIDLHLIGVPVLAAGQGARDLGIGDCPAMKMLVQVAAPGAAGPFQIALEGAPDNGSGAPGTFVTWWTSPAYATGALGVGSRLYDMDLPRPPAGVPVPRFLRMNYLQAGTGVVIHASIVLDRMDQMYNATNNAIMGGYPAGITIPN